MTLFFALRLLAQTNPIITQNPIRVDVIKTIKNINIVQCAAIVVVDLHCIFFSSFLKYLGQFLCSFSCSSVQILFLQFSELLTPSRTIFIAFYFSNIAFIFFMILIFRLWFLSGGGVIRSMCTRFWYMKRIILNIVVVANCRWPTARRTRTHEISFGDSTHRLRQNIWVFAIICILSHAVEWSWLTKWPYTIFEWKFV